MNVLITKQLRAFLKDAELPQDLRSEVDVALEHGRVAWSLLKRVTAHLGDASPSLLELCRGGGVALPPPRPPGPGKSPELEAHLAVLRRRLEQAQYDHMVADVTEGERAAAAASEGGLQSYKSQVSYGVHVLAMMAAFYLFGHALGMALTSNRTLQPLVGLVFMVGAMVLETVLFIIRTSVPPRLHAAAAERAKKARAERAMQQHQAQQHLEKDDGGAELRGAAAAAAAKAWEPGVGGGKAQSEKKDV